MKRITLLLLLTFVLASVRAQSVSGLVTDKSGAPLSGVTITLTNDYTAGTTSDLEGKWSLKSVAADETLNFSFIGFVSQAIPVGDKDYFEVKMVDEALDIEDIVVVGYGTQKKALVTGANASVKGEELSKMKQGSALESLQGAVPGLSITRSSAQPGSGTKVSIRGLGTIGNSEPLYIVDGVNVGGIDYLSPSDIESIDVLKDAASAAIYGSRAANGVVLVTTKKGKSSGDGSVSTNIAVDSYYGVQNLYNVPEALNAHQYMAMDDYISTQRGVPTSDWEDLIVNGNGTMNNQYGNNLGTKFGQYVWDQLQSGWKGTDWMKEASKKNAPIQNHSISMTGNSNDFTYAAGLSYYDQTGIIGGDIIGTGYQRLTARLNSELVLKKNDRHNILTIGENLTYTNSKSKNVSAGSGRYANVYRLLTAPPLTPVYYDEPAFYKNTHGFAPELAGLGVQAKNPVAEMFFNGDGSWSNRNQIVTNFYAQLEPIENLKIRSSFGVNVNFNNSRSYQPIFNLGANSSTTDAVMQQLTQSTGYTWTTTAAYEFKINDDHKISALIGNEVAQSVVGHTLRVQRNNSLFGDNNHAYIDNTTAASLADISVSGRDAAAIGGGMLSYLGRFSYNYREKYMADIAFRADGSSKFAPGNRWGFFPSVALGWNVSEENFMENVDFIDYAKVRASWGQNGNNQIYDFVYNSNITNIQYMYLWGADKTSPTIGSYPENVPNKDVTWETSEQLNFGLDLRMLDSRLSVTADWYNKQTKDWLIEAPILGTFGANAPFINGGDVSNKGVELALGWRDNVGDFSYNVNVSGTKNKNEVTRIANAEGIIYPDDLEVSGRYTIARVQVGHAISSFFGWETAGIFQTQEDIDNWVDKNGNPIQVAGFEGKQQPGDVIYVDQNGDGIINDDDKVDLGNPYADFEVGAQINLEYKNVYLSASLSGKFGQQVVVKGYGFNVSDGSNWSTDVYDCWGVNGNTTNALYPRVDNTNNQNNSVASAANVFDTDYLRITNLTIGYNFDKIFKGTHTLKKASIYASVSNLATFTNYWGMNPEVAYGGSNSWISGIDLGQYPLPRTYMVGVNFSF